MLAGAANDDAIVVHAAWKSHEATKLKILFYQARALASDMVQPIVWPLWANRAVRLLFTAIFVTNSICSESAEFRRWLPSMVICPSRRKFRRRKHSSPGWRAK